MPEEITFKPYELASVFLSLGYNSPMAIIWCSQLSTLIFDMHFRGYMPSMNNLINSYPIYSIIIGSTHEKAHTAKYSGFIELISN